LQSSEDFANAAGCLGSVVGLVIGLILYVFFCICAKRICLKARVDPGILIWIPIVQLIPMFQAAKLNPLWIIGLFVPILNIVVAVMLWWKLCEALNKPGVLGLIILIPVFNLGLVLYLAFAD
jgi:membrane-associated HD superfamily phosphohydrolase